MWTRLRINSMIGTQCPSCGSRLFWRPDGLDFALVVLFAVLLSMTRYIGGTPRACAFAVLTVLFLAILYGRGQFVIR